jgi:hypothetical protein
MVNVLNRTSMDIDLFNDCPFQLSVSWESNPARLMAREKKKYLVQKVKIFSSLIEIP